MNRKIVLLFTLTISMLVLIGCTVPGEENPLLDGYTGGGVRGGTEGPPSDEVRAGNNNMAIVEYFQPNFSDPEVVAKYARAKVVILVPGYVWGPGHDPNVLRSMRTINPGIKIVGYINAHSTWVNWADADPTTHPYEAAWYQATRPYWSYTTTGDTMMSWPGKVLLNILDEDCRAAMVDVIAEQWASNSNVLDGVFWDHFNTNLWVPEHVDGREGEMDLDQDGIPHLEDEDEMQAYRDASTALVQRFSSVMGEDVIQITNGNRAAKDSLFAGLVDGMMYEVFPTVGFHGDEMRSALDPSVYNNLFAARHWPRTNNGGPFLILTNKRRATLLNGDRVHEVWRLADFNRVVALLTENYVTYHPATQIHSYGWPDIELDLGNSLGGVTIDGDVITRDFANGRVMLDFNTGSPRAPFNFTIEQNGEIVQKFMVQ